MTLDTSSRKERGIVFDAGPIINLTMNNLLWILPRLKHIADMNFYITRGVKEELIDKPMKTRKYKLEALQILPYLVEGTIELLDDPKIESVATELERLMNTCMIAQNHPVALVQRGELTSMAACIVHDLDALVVDERTTRYLIETPSKLHERMRHKLHMDVLVNKDLISQIRQRVGNIRCIRSVELVSVAYSLGLFCHYTYQSDTFRVPGIEDELVEGLVWALKLNGCAIAEDEIEPLCSIIKKNARACRID